MKLLEFNLFSDKSARIFLIFPSICPSFHVFQNWEGDSCPPPAPLSRTPTVMVVKKDDSYRTSVEIFVR